MTQSDHAALHGRLSEKFKTPEHRAKARKLMQKLWDDPEWSAKQRSKLAASASARGKRTGELGKSGLHTMPIEIRRANGRANIRKALAPESRQKSAETRRKMIAENPEFREKARLRALKASQVAATKPVTEKQREARRENARKLNERQANNHKVASVEPCGIEDVYDLTVDEHHNFALSAGVFVHNCVSLGGYGPCTELFKALGVATPASAPANGYLLFTWSTIGVVDHAWLMGTCVEAWVRNPTVTDLAPPPPPVGTITVVCQSVSGAVNTPVKFTPVASGGVSPYIFLFSYGDGAQDASGQHAYAAAGSYKVTVTAVDSKGSLGTGTCTATIGVNPPDPPIPPTPGGAGTIQWVIDGKTSSYELWPIGTKQKLLDLIGPQEK
jgi:hypothetical protein